MIPHREIGTVDVARALIRYLKKEWDDLNAFSPSSFDQWTLYWVMGYMDAAQGKNQGDTAGTWYTPYKEGMTAAAMDWINKAGVWGENDETYVVTVDKKN